MNKKVLITGAAGTLGSSVTKKFLSEKISVAAIVGPDDKKDFIDHDLLEAFQGDISDERQADSIFRKALESEKKIHMAVFTVGGFGMGKLADTGLKEIRSMFQLNFETAYTSARIMFDYFIKKKVEGRMVFIGAKPGLETGMAGEMAAYGLSKSLIFSLADLVNGAGKKDKITASVIVPSVIDTPANRDGMPDADFSKWVNPDHIADVIYFNFTEAGEELRDAVFKVYGDS